MNKTQTTMNKTPYFHKPIHTASTRKREIERVLRLIWVVKSVRELKRETVRWGSFFFFFFPFARTIRVVKSEISYFEISKYSKKKYLRFFFLWNILEYVIEYSKNILWHISFFCLQTKPSVFFLIGIWHRIF